MEETGDIRGVVKDLNADPIPFAEIAIINDGVVVTDTKTDFDGKYFIKGIAVGRYTVKAELSGYTSQEDSGVQINNDQITYLDFMLGNTSS